MIGMDFAKPGGDLTALTVLQGCGKGQKIKAVYFIPRDFNLRCDKCGCMIQPGLQSYLYHEEHCINGEYTEDAEFEIIQPKQLLDANKI